MKKSIKLSKRHSWIFWISPWISVIKQSNTDDRLPRNPHVLIGRLPFWKKKSKKKIFLTLCLFWLENLRQLFAVTFLVTFGKEKMPQLRRWDAQKRKTRTFRVERDVIFWSKGGINYMFLTTHALLNTPFLEEIIWNLIFKVSSMI